MTKTTDFSKWQGLGNDYVILDVSDLDFDMTPARASLICNRNFGIGSDGLLLWSGTESAGFRLEIFNPDGSTAEMCGNGIRMLARYLNQKGFAEDTTIAIETDAGQMAPVVLPDGQVKVHMGKARLGGSGIIGFDGNGDGTEAIGQKLVAMGEEYEFTFVDVGNPHCVIETGDLEDLSLWMIGPAIERHNLFPNRVNVEFMKVTGPSEVSMRVWERGVGETNACGTGACAVAVAAYRTRGVNSPVTVTLPGGRLTIEVEPGMDVTMTGPAEEIYSGRMSIDFITRVKEL